MYIDHKENENDPGTRFCLNANRADIANVALNLNNITTETNVPVYFKNGTPSQILEIPNSLIGDLSDKYLSTSGGIVNGNITADNFIGNASSADKLNLANDVGAINTPVYFKDGIPVPCNELKTETLTVNVNGSMAGSFDGSEAVTIDIDTISEEDVNNLLSGYLPLTAGEEYKISGPLGFTEVSYGSMLPETGFEGQLFFLEDAEAGIPAGGTAGQVLIKNSSRDGDSYWGDVVALPEGGSVGQALVKNSTADGDASWKDIVALPKGGDPGQVLVKNTTADGDASWAQADYLPLSGGYMYGAIRGAKGYYTNDNLAELWNHGGIEIRENDFVESNEDSIGYAPTLGFHWSNRVACSLSLGSDGVLYLYNNVGNLSTFTAGKVYGAVWNDYAEYRTQKEIIKPGYCVASADDGQVYKTTEKFQACDGIVSDTFGFAIGETENCKTPLAVAGRVLAYCEGNRYDYHSGDTVCAGPDGKVCKMTREEIREWPDRIVGIVSEIPEYETWGTGNVLVDGRIWIKIK